MKIKSIVLAVVLFVSAAAFAQQGTSTQVLHGSTTGAPSFSAVNLSTDTAGADQTTDTTKAVKVATSGATTATATTLAFAQTAARTVTFPDASITVGSTVTQACGTAVACSATITNNVKVAYGSAPFTSASPSTASITGLPFTSSSTYWCTVTPNGATAAISAAGASTNKTSGSAMTITGPNTVTTVMDYVCYGT